MTNEDKKRIFEYMGWKMPCDGRSEELYITKDDKHSCRICEFYHPLDGNDMVAAMNKMVQEGKDWEDFILLCWDKHHNDKYCYSGNHKRVRFLFVADIMQPTRFFKLMANWLKEKENENSRT